MSLQTCNVIIDQYGQELSRHGSADFPIACYNDDLNIDPVPWHWHEELEAMVVEEGEMLLGCGSEQYVVGVGEGFIINSGVLHGCWSHQSPDCRIHSIVFHPRLVGGARDSVFFRKYLQPLIENRIGGGLFLSPELPWQAEIMEHIEGAWKLVNEEPEGYEFDVWHHLSGIVQLLHNHLPAGAADANQKSQKDVQRIKGMMQFVHEHYWDRITVAEIARSVSISESECLRCFRATVQLTPNQYLRQYRVQQSAKLLISTQEKIHAIAHACGFEDLSFYAKTFREVMGVTPSEYRNQRK